MRQRKGMNDTFLISLSFLVGFILTILPLPQWMVWYRPSWILLILIYWLMARPHRVGIVVSWLIGLLLDLMTGSLLGLHALIFTIFAYFILKFHRIVRTLSLGQKLLLVFIIEILNLSIQYLIGTYFNVEPDTFRYWLPILTTTIFWPMVAAVLTTRKNQRKVI